MSFVIHYLSGGKKLIKLQIGKKGSEDMCGVSRVGACELFNHKLKTRAERWNDEGGRLRWITDLHAIDMHRFSKVFWGHEL